VMWAIGITCFTAFFFWAILIWRTYAFS